MSPAPARHRILVAEDEAAIRQLITVRLQTAGYQVFTARPVAMRRAGLRGS
jgi:DNA-binding response OmpR family regulator